MITYKFFKDNQSITAFFMQSKHQIINIETREDGFRVWYYE